MQYKYHIKMFIVILTTIMYFVSNAFSQTDIEKIESKFQATVESEIGNGYLVIKKNKYGFVDYEMELKIPIRYNSIKLSNGNVEVLVVERKKKYGLYSLDFKELLECKYSICDYIDIGYIVEDKKGKGLFCVEKNKFIIENIYDSIKIEENPYHGYNDVYVYKSGKIGLYIYDYELVKIFDCKWNSVSFNEKEINDVGGNYFESYYKVGRNDSTFYYSLYDYKPTQIITEGYSNANIARMKTVNADSINMDGVNGDGLFKARNIVSQKWGMFQDLGDTIVQRIPAQYDSVYYFGWNYPYTMVFNNGLAGIYLWEWTEIDDKPTAQCIYEDYKKVSSQSDYYYFAGKIDGKWFWIDWYINKKTRESSWSSYNEMNLSYSDRSSYYER